jgi:phytoene/squalene synthetase
MERYNVPEADIAARRFTPAFAELLRFECNRTHGLFDEGMKLLPLVERRLRLDIEMFGRGGLEVLRMIEAQGYDVLTKRPAIPKRRQIAMLFRRLLSR